MSRDKSARVYSTDVGRTCPGCGHAVARCCCSKQKSVAKGDGVVRISRQTKGRKGSGVCLVSGLSLSDSELKSLANQMKKKCGTGGTIKDGVIEIQGDHRQTIAAILAEHGITAKIAGG